MCEKALQAGMRVCAEGWKTRGLLAPTETRGVTEGNVGQGRGAPGLCPTGVAGVRQG